MAGFQTFNKNSRLNNLALLQNIGQLDVPGATPVAGNTYRKTFTAPGNFTFKIGTEFKREKRTISPIPKSVGATSTMEVLVVAGGGGGDYGGGGGAGAGGGVVYDDSFESFF
jgi:hypothetical protein